MDIINIFTEEGKINNNAPQDYVGLDRFDARKKLLEELKEKDFFVKEENIKNKDYKIKVFTQDYISLCLD